MRSWGMNCKKSASIGYPSTNFDARPSPWAAAISRACTSDVAATAAALPSSNRSHHIRSYPHFYPQPQCGLGLEKRGMARQRCRNFIIYMWEPEFENLAKFVKDLLRGGMGAGTGTFSRAPLPCSPGPPASTSPRCGTSRIRKHDTGSFHPFRRRAPAASSSCTLGTSANEQLTCDPRFTDVAASNRRCRCRSAYPSGRKAITERRSAYSLTLTAISMVRRNAR
jgi:hypothetical protein